MGFSQRLEVRQSQALVMTPQLQQAIKMLQLSNLELTDFVDAEIQQNPLLERRERNAEEAAPAAVSDAAENIISTALPETLQGDFSPDAAEHWHAAAGAEGDGSVDLGGEPQSWHNGAGGFGAEDRHGFEQTAARPRTLREHVIEQIGTDLTEQGDQLIALHLLDLLDETGYLGGTLDGVALLLGCDLGPGRGSSRPAPAIRSRRGSSPAISPNAWRYSYATATGSIRRCKPCSTTCRCSPRATSRR